MRKVETFSVFRNAFRERIKEEIRLEFGKSTRIISYLDFKKIDSRIAVKYEEYTRDNYETSISMEDYIDDNLEELL